MIFDINIPSVKDRSPYQDSKYIGDLKSYILYNTHVLSYNELISIMNELVDAYIECGYGLTTRGERYYPHCYEGLESQLTVTIARDYRYGDIIKIPKNDLLYLAIFYIFSLPRELWGRYNFPIVTFRKHSVRNGAEEILGSEIASVYTALMMYGGGSMSFFEKLQNSWSFDIETGELRKLQQIGMYIDCDMFAAKKMIDNHSSSLISENKNILESILPIPYYKGDGDYMLLATQKNIT